MDDFELVLLSQNSDFVDLVKTKLNSTSTKTVELRSYQDILEATKNEDLYLIDGILIHPTEQTEYFNKSQIDLLKSELAPLIIVTDKSCTEEEVNTYFEEGVDDILEFSKTMSSQLLQHKIKQTIQSTRQRESEVLLNRVTDSYFSLDTQYRFQKYNQSGFELLRKATSKQITADSIKGKELWTVVPDLLETEFEEEFVYAMEQKEERHFTSYYDPLDLWAEISVYPSSTGLSVFLKDVTEKKQLEIEREENLEVLFSLYNLAADTELSHKDRIKEAVRLGREMLGLSYGFVTQITDGEQIIEFCQNEIEHEGLSEGAVCPVDETYCQHILDKAEPLTIENASESTVVNTPEYERFELNSYISQKIVIDGEVYGTLCFADDGNKETEFTDVELAITELLSGWVSYEIQRKHTQDKLQEKNEQLEAFAGFISHDLRNPLSIAQGYLNMELKQRESENLQKVKNAHERIDGLISNLLDLTRTADLIQSTEQVSLEEIAIDSWSNLQTYDSEIQVQTTKTIAANYDKLLNVFENLYKNAIEHNNDPVTITVGDTPSGFYIQDDGTGVGTEDIFEYGVSGSGSTGLGLSIVQKIVEAHGWEVELDSSYTDGARFVITTE